MRWIVTALDEPGQQTLRELQQFVDHVHLRFGFGGANHPTIKEFYRLAEEAEALITQERSTHYPYALD